MISSKTILKHWIHTTTITVTSSALEMYWVAEVQAKVICIQYYTQEHMEQTFKLSLNFKNIMNTVFGIPNANALTNFDSFAFIYARLNKHAYSQKQHPAGKWRRAKSISFSHIIMNCEHDFCDVQKFHSHSHWIALQLCLHEWYICSVIY